MALHARSNENSEISLTLPTLTRQALARIAAGSPASTLESATLDFKTVGRSRDDTLINLADAAVCFANAGGGQIVVGVPDGATSLDSRQDVDLDARNVQRRIFELTDPSLIVTVEEDREVPHDEVDAAVAGAIEMFDDGAGTATRGFPSPTEAGSAGRPGVGRRRVGERYSRDPRVGGRLRQRLRGGSARPHPHHPGAPQPTSILASTGR